MSNRRGDTTANVVGAVVLIGLGVLIGVVLRSGGGGGGGGGCPGRLSATMDEVLDPTQYTNAELATDVSPLSYDSRGEIGHRMFEAGGMSSVGQASIQRLAGSGHRRASCFDDHPSVVGVIYGDEFTPLYLTGGNETNWFVMWRKTSDNTWHGAMLSMTKRHALDKVEYKAHYQSGGAPDPDDPSAGPPSELASRIQECWKATSPTRRACFAEVQKKTTSTAMAAVGFGLRLFAFQPEDGSVPWVACAQSGCCCGGEGCHQ